MKAEGKVLFLSSDRREMDFNGEKSEMVECKFHDPDSNEILNIFVTEKFHTDIFELVVNMKDYTPCVLTGEIKADKKTNKPTFKIAGLVPQGN